MPRIDPIRRAAWAERPSAWPGPLPDAALDRLNTRLDALPPPVADALLAILDDPTDEPRAQALLAVLHRVPDGAITAIDATGLALGPVRVAVASVAPGPPPDVLAALDRVFGDDGWALRLRRPLPDTLDLEPIKQSLRLWLGARSMAADTPATVTYDHGEVSLEFTLLEPLVGGRRLTVGARSRPPLDGLDDVLDGASVVAVRSGQRFGRHALQTALYGPPHETTIGPDGATATVARGGWLGDHPSVAEVWWIDPEPAPFGVLSRLVNPWAPAGPLVPSCDRTCEATADGAVATLRWRGGD